MTSIFEKLSSGPDINSDNAESLKPLDRLNKQRQSYKYAMAKAVLPIAIVSSLPACTLERDGLQFPDGTGANAGIGGSAGSGADAGGSAGEGGSAGSAGKGGSAGEGGCFPTEEVCDGQDNDCNGETDENLLPPLCDKTMGVCATPANYPECDGENGWIACEYNSDYEATETKCDNKDNDCDGDTDEMSDLEGHQPLCAEPNEGVCQGATAARTCENGQWSTCEYGSDYEQGSELSCDGLDNNCDGTADERCVTTQYNNHPYEQLIIPDGTTNTPLDGSTGDETCETTDTTALVSPGNVQVIYLHSGVNNVVLKTTLTPSQIQGGCGPFLNCPDNDQLWTDWNDITKDNNINTAVNGDELSIVHTIACGRNIFFITW